MLDRHMFFVYNRESKQNFLKWCFSIFFGHHSGRLQKRKGRMDLPKYNGLTTWISQYLPDFMLLFSQTAWLCMKLLVSHWESWQHFFHSICLHFSGTHYRYSTYSFPEFQIWKCEPIKICPSPSNYTQCNS